MSKIDFLKGRNSCRYIVGNNSSQTIHWWKSYWRWTSKHRCGQPLGTDPIPLSDAGGHPARDRYKLVSFRGLSVKDKHEKRDCHPTFGRLVIPCFVKVPELVEGPSIWKNGPSTPSTGSGTEGSGTILAWIILTPILSRQRRCVWVSLPCPKAQGFRQCAGLCRHRPPSDGDRSSQDPYWAHCR